MTADETTQGRGSPYPGRILGIIGVVAAGAAVVLVGTVAFGDAEQPTLYTQNAGPTSLPDEPATAEPLRNATTSTVAAPFATAVGSTSTQPRPERAAPATPDSTTPDSATPDSTTPDSTTPDSTTTTSSSIPKVTAPPVAVETDRIDLSEYAIRPIGLEENGELEVPDETEIGWYEHGAAPGENGVTVLAAHVSWNRQLGPFAHLGTMEPGDTIHVTIADGSVEPYLVTERIMYPKDELPSERLWRNVGEESLALITCGGRFDDSINRYRDNIVVYASPVSS